MPVELSIGSCLADVPSSKMKAYLWTMAVHGIEMGVGRSGYYAAHAHRNMVDVIFSPDGMRSSDPSSRGFVSGSLLVALPGTWFGPVISGNFFFIKFYCYKNRSGVPDKIDEPTELEQGTGGTLYGLMVAQGLAMLRLPLFRHCQHEVADTAEFCLTGSVLECQLSDMPALMVRK
jgi:hypothetical protein